MKDIRIILEGNELELSDKITLPVNFQMEDLTNPTAVKVGYTKTITIEGTSSNNAIFANIWNLERITEIDDQYNEGVYFNPSKRADCVIYRNGDIVFEGYAKLDIVDFSGEQVKYNITVYSNLADFFYSLTYNESGDTKTLADLDYGVNLDFNITTTAVRAAWDNLSSGNVSNRWGIINFNPNCYEGLPDDFDADKVLIKAYNSTIFPYSGGTQNRYTLYDGYAMGELDEEYTGLEMRDLRSYHMRPVMSIKGLFKGFQDRNSNGGYELVLDKGFFNTDNPYYEKAWFTLPLLTNLDGIEGQTLTGQTSIVTQVGGGTAPLNFVSGQLTGTSLSLVSYGYGTLDLDFNFNLLLSMPQQYANNVYYTSYSKYETYPGYYDGDGDYFPPRTIVSLGVTDGVRVRIQAVDGNGNVVSETPWHIFGNAITEYANKTGAVAYEGSFLHSSASEWRFVGKDGTRDFIIKMKNVPKASFLSFNVEVRFPDVWNSTKEEIEYAEEPSEGGYYERYHSYPTKAANKPYIRKNVSYVTFAEESATHSGTKITKDKLLGGLGTPCDYLLSYCKMFGLYFIKDKYEKKITIVPRNKFYTGEIENIDENIDYSQDHKLTPLTFDSKWYTFKNEAVESAYIDTYNKDYKADYAEQKINTNYNFDSEEKDLCENNIFKTAVMARGKSNYYRKFYTTTGTLVPAFYTKTFNYILYSGGTSVDETYEQDKVLNGGTYVNYYTKKGGYDCNPRLALMDEKRDAVDGENVLLFFSGFERQLDVNGNLISYYLTDDVDEMFLLNEQVPCWLHTNANISKGTTTSGYTDYYAFLYATTQGGGAMQPKLPAFSRYIVENNNIVYSMDYGEPKELYVDNYNSDSSTTVYNKFWKAYMNDQLSIDSRIFECNVYFPNLEEASLRKLFYFKNSLWALNKVTDYDLAGEGTTKCEFIKIVEKNNYTKGQILGGEDAELYFADDYYAAITSYNVGGTHRTGSITVAYWNVENIEIVSYPSWFAAMYDEDNGILHYSVPQNGSSSRRGTVTVRGTNVYTGDEITADLMIIQDAYYVSLSISPLGVTVPADTSRFTYTLRITTNGIWDITYLPDWITEYDRTENSFIYKVAVNTSDRLSRRSYIEVSATLPGATAKKASMEIQQSKALT